MVFYRLRFPVPYSCAPCRMPPTHVQMKKAWSHSVKSLADQGLVTADLPGPADFPLQTFQSCRRPLVSLCRHCTARHRAPAAVCHGFTIALCHCALRFPTIDFITEHCTPALITEHGTVQCSPALNMELETEHWHWALTTCHCTAAL